MREKIEWTKVLNWLWVCSFMQDVGRKGNHKRVAQGQRFREVGEVALVKATGSWSVGFQNMGSTRVS